MVDTVINLFERKNKAKEKTENTDKPETEVVNDFTSEMERNKKNAERVARERANKNKNVKHGYNLRPNDPNNKR